MTAIASLGRRQARTGDDLRTDEAGGRVRRDTRCGVRRDRTRRGVVQFKGLPVVRDSHDQRGTVFFGIASHPGTAAYQSARGELLGEIRDESPDVGLMRGQMRGQMTDGDGKAFLSSRSRAQATQLLRWRTGSSVGRPGGRRRLGQACLGRRHP